MSQKSVKLYAMWFPVCWQGSLSLSLFFCFRWADEYGKTDSLYHGSKVAVIPPPSSILDEAVLNACSMRCLLTVTWASSLSQLCPTHSFTIVLLLFSSDVKYHMTIRLPGFFSRFPAFHVSPARAKRKSPLLVGEWCGSSWGKSYKNLSLKSMEMCVCAREECCRYQVRLPWLSFV